MEAIQLRYILRIMIPGSGTYMSTRRNRQLLSISRMKIPVKQAAVRAAQKVAARAAQKAAARAAHRGAVRAAQKAVVRASTRTGRKSLIHSRI